MVHRQSMPSTHPLSSSPLIHNFMVIGERFRNHVDLDHVVQHVSDSHKKHRALLLKRPTTELSGLYTCKVSTFVSEDVRRKKMTVYCKFLFKFLFYEFLKAIRLYWCKLFLWYYSVLFHNVNCSKLTRFSNQFRNYKSKYSQVKTNQIEEKKITTKDLRVLWKFGFVVLKLVAEFGELIAISIVKKDRRIS